MGKIYLRDLAYTTDPTNPIFAVGRVVRKRRQWQRPAAHGPEVQSSQTHYILPPHLAGQQFRAVPQRERSHTLRATLDEQLRELCQEYSIDQTSEFWRAVGEMFYC